MVDGAQPPDREPRGALIAVGELVDLRDRPELRRMVGGYAARRISESYDHVTELLEPFAALGTGAAYDVGCGTGFDTWALREHFDRVLAVDVSRRAIARSRLLARRVGATGIDFRRADAQSWTPEERFDLVYCNLVSHNASRHDAFLDRLVAAMATDGHLYLAEITEGYVPMEVHAAVAARDSATLRARLRQALNGLLGKPGFSFLFSGRTPELLEQRGLQAVRRETTDWKGLATSERLWLRRASTTVDADARFVGPGAPEHVDELRARSRALALRRDDDGLSPADVRLAQDWAATSDNPLAPLALLVVMADAALADLTSEPGPIGRRLEARLRPIDWPRIGELDEILVQAVSRNAAVG